MMSRALSTSSRQVRALRQVALTRPASTSTSARATLHSIRPQSQSASSQQAAFLVKRFLSGQSKLPLSCAATSPSSVRGIATRTVSAAMASKETPSGAQAKDFEAGKEMGKQETQPGQQHKMEVKPETIPEHYKGSGKLEGKTALITGGDSGIGRSIAALYAMEGADVGITFVSGDEDKDANETLQLVEEVTQGKKQATKYSGDLGYDENCKKVIEDFLKDHKKIDILVNHAGEQTTLEKLEDITSEQLERTFRTNVYSQFYLTKYALPHMAEGSCIINTASINAYKGNASLVDYTATKGANVAFTRAMALQLAPRKIRVNGVAPGPIWTPLIPATMKEEKVDSFGENTPLGRAGHPSEVAPCYVFLAANDSSYMSGQVLHPNGGVVVNG